MSYENGINEVIKLIGVKQIEIEETKDELKEYIISFEELHEDFKKEQKKVIRLNAQKKELDFEILTLKAKIAELKTI